MSLRRALSRTFLVAATTAIAAGSGAALPAMAVPRSPAPPAPTGRMGAATGPLSRRPAARVEAIEAALTNQMARLGIPGLSLAGGELVLDLASRIARLVVTGAVDEE